jgi:hypothetical protein
MEALREKWRRFALLDRIWMNGGGGRQNGGRGQRVIRVEAKGGIAAERVR